eukprot:scaffold3668_cov108-Skeletonema_dohrnii-CCMP3373.AAC.1
MCRWHVRQMCSSLQWCISTNTRSCNKIGASLASQVQVHSCVVSVVRRRGVSSRLSGNLNLPLRPTSRQPTPHPGINRDAGVVVQKEPLALI